MNKVWTQEEIDFLKRNWMLRKDKELAQDLSNMTGRSVSIKAVREQRYNLGLRKQGYRGGFKYDCGGS